MNNEIIHDADNCPWETGALGLSEDHAVPVSEEHESAVDEALELQLISIRLPRGLIADLKFIATNEGLGYQPMVRRVLQRFVAHEFKNMAHETLVSTSKVSSAEPVAIDEPQRRTA